MNEEKLVREEISYIENNTTKLYKYLYDLYYTERIKDISVIEKVLASYLDDRRSAIRRVAIYGLLFGLKIRHEKYRSAALRFINDPDSDFDLRMFSLSGLSQAYMGCCEASLALKSITFTTHHDGDLLSLIFNKKFFLKYFVISKLLYL